MTYGSRSAFGVGMIHGIGAETPTQVLIFLAAAGAGGKLVGLTLLGCFLVGLLTSNTLIGLDGPMKGVDAVRLNGKLFWSNGAVWDNFDLNVLNAFFEMAAGYP